MADFIQEILAKIFGGVVKEVAKRAGVDNLIGNVLSQGKRNSTQEPHTEISHVKMSEEPYKGELPEGLFAFVDYGQMEGKDDWAKIFVISKSYKGNVTFNINGTGETISVKPCEQVYFKAVLPPKAGTPWRLQWEVGN